MKRNIAIALLSLSLFACKKSGDAAPAAKILEPGEVCKKMADLNNAGEKAAMMVPICTAMLEGVKTKSKAGYECLAKCVDAAKDKDTAKKCDDQCPEFKAAMKP